MDKISSSLINFFAYAPVCFLAVFCLSSGVAEAQEKSYSDCAYIEFDDVDPSTLTLQERIALEEAALLMLPVVAVLVLQVVLRVLPAARVIAAQTRVSSNSNLHQRHRKLRWIQKIISVATAVAAVLPYATQ